ncbi:hypothetical protein [Brassicibacter mesophilus]|uniref:hypothetical protein n=1 Tax=Brassicibacter mesophilus TaxID=745119 RepID=UPI003D215D13
MNKYKIEKRDNHYHIYFIDKRSWATTKAYTFFENYSDFGFGSKEDFIYAYVKRQLDKQQKERIEGLIAHENKIEGYKTKLLNDKKMEIRNHIKEKHGNLLYAERERLVERAITNISERAIKWRFLKDLNEKEIKSLKRKLLLKKKDIKAIIEKIEIDESFETVKEVYSYFSAIIDPMDYLDLKIDWGECPIIAGNTAILVIYDDKYKIMSSNLKKEEGIAFDLLDLFQLYNIDMYKIIEMKGLKVKEYEKIKQGQVLLDLEKNRLLDVKKKMNNKRVLNQYPKLYKYLKTIWSVYNKVLDEGLKNINHFDKDGRAVFFASRRHLSKILLDEDNLKISDRKVGDKINILCAVGLLKKVFIEEIPVELHPDRNEKTKRTRIYKPEMNDCNYFIIPETIDLKDAEAIVIKFIENSINQSNFTYRNIASVLGREVADSIFQKTYKKAKKNIQEEETIEDYKDEDINETLMDDNDGFRIIDESDPAWDEVCNLWKKDFL